VAGVIRAGSRHGPCWRHRGHGEEIAMVLTFVIIFVVGMIWDTGRVNRLLGTTIKPGQKQIRLE
jgi:hypothetical protein